MLESSRPAPEHQFIVQPTVDTCHVVYAADPQATVGYLREQGINFIIPTAQPVYGTARLYIQQPLTPDQRLRLQQLRCSTTQTAHPQPIRIQA